MHHAHGRRRRSLMSRMPLSTHSSMKVSFSFSCFRSSWTLLFKSSFSLLIPCMAHAFSCTAFFNSCAAHALSRAAFFNSSFSFTMRLNLRHLSLLLILSVRSFSVSFSLRLNTCVWRSYFIIAVRSLLVTSAIRRCSASANNIFNVSISAIALSLRLPVAL